MIDAADSLFAERGYTGTRMADVAAAAGVAVQTVYFTFHTKSELLEACFERAVMGPDEPLPPQQQPFWLAMMAADSGREAIGHFVNGIGTIARRVAKLDMAVASAVHEPEAVAIWTRSEQLRRSGFHEAVEHIAGRFGLREGLDAEAATDVLLTLGGHAVYCDFVYVHAWSHERFLLWLEESVALLLLPPSN